LSHVIGVSLGTALGAASQLLEGRFKQAFETVKQGGKDMAQIVPDTWERMTTRLGEIDAAFLASKEENVTKEEELSKQSTARKAQVSSDFAAEEASKALARQIEQQAIDMQILEASEEERARIQLQARIKAQENLLKTTVDAQKKLAIQQEIFNLNEQQKQVIADQRSLDNKKATFATIATLSNSHNASLAAIGKAAAITQIAIETPVAISKALAAFPPPYNFVAAGLVGTAMAAQAANIAGVQLAEGGIVKARPGGIQATIGEGGQDEMVIPLDRAAEFGVGGGGGGHTINFYGPIMGDETQAREFALKVDQELLKLRQNNESVSFDSGVT
jgi:actin-related protein